MAWCSTIIVTSIICLLHIASGGPMERRLLNDLMKQYNKLERPVANESSAVKLKFGLALQQIIDVDEKNQILTSNVWLNLEWTDANLRWNSSEYGNVEDIRMPPSVLWKPDILMYNSASETFDGTYPTNVVVTHEGLCTYIPPGIFMSTCKIDITWFPFDDQSCEMKFGSWTYNGFNVDLQMAGEEGDMSTYVENGEWDLKGIPAIRNEVIYDCCPEPYLDITFRIKIRRRTVYYFFNLIVPCVLIASMAILGFTLPPDSGEKLSLGVTVLLSLTVFQESVSQFMPITSLQIPLLGTYFNCIMFMVASSVVTTIMVLNYHHRLADTHEMPEWVKITFLQWLPWFLRMGRPGEKITRKTIMMQNKMKELDLKEKSSKSCLANILDLDGQGGYNGGANTLPRTFMQSNSNCNGAFFRVSSHGHMTPAEESPLPPPATGISRELGLILKEIRVITDKIADDADSGEIEGDWKFAAMVLDRICLIVFTIFTFTASVATLWSAPHIVVK